ncbi:MAG: tRNA pseudouridine(13) synthase TruD [Glaciecola sp.]
MLDFPAMDWCYWQGKPTATARFKEQLEDFVVTEDLGFSPSGQGEHIFVHIEKKQLNTAYVAEQLAAFTGLPLRAISYAGRKDKFSISRQWFGVHAPGKQDFPWAQWQLDGARILDTSRHDKKLRTGVLKRNHFAIRLKRVSDPESVIARLGVIQQQGVPNYFGMQRFGEVRYLDEEGQQQTKVGGNLTLAHHLLEGKAIKNRNKRSVAISALRAWLFNTFVSERLAHFETERVLEGDVCILAGSNSYFCAEDVDTRLTQRLSCRDIALSAPLWGKGAAIAQAEALQFENKVAQRYPQITTALENLGLKQERRSLLLHPEALEFAQQDDHIRLSFYLPKGCFATAVIRELVECV